MSWVIILLMLVLSSRWLPPAGAATLEQSNSGSGRRLIRGRIVKEEILSSSALLESAPGEAVVLDASNFDAQLVERLNGKGVITAIEPSLDRFVFYKGRLLLSTSRKQHLLLANADLELAPNSLVYICDNGYGTCAILNLHDEHYNAVRVRVGKSSFYLPPGRQLILTSIMQAGFDDVNLCSGIGFRSVDVFMPAPTIKAFCTQYSLASATQVLPAVHRLAMSNMKQAKRMLKTGAAVYAISGYPSDFRLSNSAESQ